MRRCLRLQLIFVQDAPISNHAPISTHALISTFASASASTFVPSPAVYKLFSDSISDSVKQTDKNVGVHVENLIATQILWVSQHGLGRPGRRWQSWQGPSVVYSTIIHCPNQRLLLSISETVTLPLSRSEANMKKLTNLEFLLLPGIFCTKFLFFPFLTSSIANLSTGRKKKMFGISYAVVRPQILSTALNFVGLRVTLSRSESFTVLT